MSVLVVSTRFRFVILSGLRSSFCFDIPQKNIMTCYVSLSTSALFLHRNVFVEPCIVSQSFSVLVST